MYFGKYFGGLGGGDIIGGPSFGVPDSRTAGYLGPAAQPAPAEDNAWDDFLYDLFIGITNLPENLVRPRWQPEPPVQPDVGVDWMAFGTSGTEGLWRAPVTHFPGTAAPDGTQASPDGDGFSLLQEHETSTVLCVFYGPHANATAALLRDGLRIDQNQAVLRAAGAALVECGPFTRAPELFKQQWLNRVDMNVVFRREIRRVYPELNLLRAQGTITSNDPGSRTVEDQFDTDNVEG